MASANLTYNSSPGQRARQLLQAAVLTVAALYFGREFLIPLAMAVLLTFLLAPAVTWLERRKLHRVPAVLLVMAIIFSSLGVGGWFVGRQLYELAKNVPTYKDSLVARVKAIRPGGDDVIDSVEKTIDEVGEEITGEEPVVSSPDLVADEPLPVTIIPSTRPIETLQLYVETFMTPAAYLAIITVLVLFMLLQREDLRNRVVRLAGKKLTLTTRTLDDVGQRISRYLLMLCLVNGSFGLSIAIGLWLIGVPYALLWGSLAAVLRFIPYVGPVMAAAFPITMSVIAFPADDWLTPTLTIGLIVVLELISNNIIEPLAYGRSTGVSIVALLVSATFWTWIWGEVGLMLSVPITVVLAVLGEHVTALEPLAILLGDKPPLPVYMTYYQRLLAADFDEAASILAEHLKGNCLENTYDSVVVPALVLAERDFARGDLPAETQKFIWQSTRDLVEESAPELAAALDAECVDPNKPTLRAKVIGVPAHDMADELSLTMLRQLTHSGQAEFVVLPTTMLVSEVVARIEKELPDAVCISSLGPVGGRQARYICKRIRQRYPNMRLIVGRWGFRGDRERMVTDLKQRGADQVVTTLEEARDLMLRLQPLPDRDLFHAVKASIANGGKG